MNLKRAIFFIGVIVALFLLFPLLLFVNKNLAYYSYKQATFCTILNNVVVGQEKNPEKIILAVEEYFYNNLFTPAQAEVVDKDTYNDLLRGIAWCDQRSWGALGSM